MLITKKFLLLTYMKKIDDKDLSSIFKKTFSKSKISKNINKLKMGDIQEWDSMGNFSLLLNIEKFYKIRFTMEEMSDLKSIKNIKLKLKKKYETQ